VTMKFLMEAIRKNLTKTMCRALCAVAMALCVLSCALPASAARIEEKILKAWTRSGEYQETGGIQSVAMKVTYYSAEYIEALVRSEAESKLWTKNEEEQFKYNLLKTLNLEENIAFHLEFEVRGSPAYLQPFDRHFKLFAGKAVLEPADYDKRFNFKLDGKRDGMLWFPRYNEKTGKSYLEGIKELRLVVNGSMTLATSKLVDVRFIWDITGDDPSILGSGSAVAKLELDRLIKRIDKLHADREDLQKKLNVVNDELAEINNRVDELQRQ